MANMDEDQDAAATVLQRRFRLHSTDSMLERAATNSSEVCAVDTKPNDGVGCVKPGGPHAPAKTETVCGTCGVLYDVSYPTGVKYVKK